MIMEHRSSNSEFLNVLRYLVREPSVVGMEDAFFRVLRRELERPSVSIYRYQGLMVVQGQRPESGFLSAHVDRHGLLCTGPREFQYAAFIAANRGELNGDSISEQFMELIAGRFRDQRVQAHVPFAGSYLGQGIIRDSYICPRRKNLIFEIEGLDYLQPGTPISFLDRLQEKNGKISAQLDNVISVAVIIELFALGYEGTAFFSAGEESGKSWRYLAEWFQRADQQTDQLIVLDTSPFPSDEDLDRFELALRNRDSTAEFDPKLTEQIRNDCVKLGIQYCYKDEYIEQQNQHREKKSSIGRTELGRLISATNGSITGTTLQLPTSSYHTHMETAKLTSVDAMIRLLGHHFGL